MDFQKPGSATAASRRLMAMMMRDKPTTAQNSTTTAGCVKYEADEAEAASDDTTATATGGGEDEEMKKQKKGGGSGGGGGGGRRGGGGGGGGGGGISCQADKCMVDLTEAKRYHRRHKVCEFHAKAASVVVSGLRQRFCQQCSRFHELTEFDETKRSCRRRLAGHNERRRKSSSDPQGEGGSSSSTRPKGAGPHCRPTTDHERGNRVQMPYPGNPAYKHFRSDKFGVVND